MKKSILSTALVFIIMVCFASAAICATKKPAIYDIEYETKDHFITHSTLTYPAEQKEVYPLVVLLHSLGYSSAYWGELITDFNKAGIATLEIDIKGHGKSATDAYFKSRSWIYFSEKDFQSIPEEAANIIKQTLSEHKNISPNHVVYVGADMGANAAIWMAEMVAPKPVCLVLISPYVNFKGLYTPIKLANAGQLPIMAIASQKDLTAVKQLSELEKYAQGVYTKKIYSNGGSGMIMLKLNKEMPVDIVNWAVSAINAK